MEVKCDRFGNGDEGTWQKHLNTHTQTHAHTHKHAHMHAHTHTHTLTYTHTYTQREVIEGGLIRF